MMTTDSAKTKVTPCTTGKSRLLIEVSIRLPRPLSWNTRSTTTVAPMRKAMLMPRRVSVGMMRVAGDVDEQHAVLAEALGAHGGDVVGLEDLEHADAQAAHQERHDRQGRRERRAG